MCTLCNGQADRRPGEGRKRACGGPKMSQLKLSATHSPVQIDLFQGLDSKTVKLLLAAASPRRYSAPCVITHQGHPADYLMLLWKGRARYFYQAHNGRKMILMWITPGDIFGGAALVFQPSNYLVSTEAVSGSVVLAWDAPTIRDLARRFPKILENALTLALEHVTWYTAAYSSLTSRTARERLAHILVGLAPSIGRRTAGGIELDVTNEELAHSANITLFTVSRLLSDWQNAGAIRKRRGRLILRSPEKLFLRVV